MTDSARVVHLLLPAGYGDPLRASGGNRYDAELVAGLAGLGWSVVVHEVPNAWPDAGPDVARSVEAALTSIADGRVVLVDGLLGTAAAAALLGHADRLRQVALVHMSGPPGGPPAAVLHAARLVVATSHVTAGELERVQGLAAGSVLVAPPGAAPAELAPGTAGGGALLCVAAVSRLKGHDLLVAALARLAGLTATPWSCVCAGALDREPGFVAEQRRALAAAGIADRVRFAGPLAGAALDRAYAGADVVLLASRQESYGMVVTEALARGLPVIATAVGGVPEALGVAANGRSPGALVPPDDPAALAAAIATWLDDGARREELRSAARSRRDHLGGWQQTVAVVSGAVTGLATACAHP